MEAVIVASLKLLFEVLLEKGLALGILAVVIYVLWRENKSLKDEVKILNQHILADAKVNTTILIQNNEIMAKMTEQLQLISDERDVLRDNQKVMLSMLKRISEKKLNP